MQWKYRCLSSIAQTLPFPSSSGIAAFLAAAAVAAPARAVSFGGSEFHVAASDLVCVSNRQTNLTFGDLRSIGSLCKKAPSMMQKRPPNRVSALDCFLHAPMGDTGFLCFHCMPSSDQDTAFRETDTSSLALQCLPPHKRDRLSYFTCVIAAFEGRETRKGLGGCCVCAVCVCVRWCGCVCVCVCVCVVFFGGKCFHSLRAPT